MGLIKQDSSIENICQQRDLALTTVLSHINKLANSGRIERSKRQQLFAKIHTDKAINHWILQGLEQVDSIEKIQHHLNIMD
ncbi:helix-turn-helix domain-containing protein [Isorropodon fossajaponicum symbiont]|uniref:helix-turn-helix domain-containing protein n=1 Tax=Isorropodon fossajaponicum symbiont TaxID=883811 RepID=UPI0019164496|nr:helix-turn-helix domain-containing protein [Isorropodon fossajaponicum symbiont]